MSSSSDPLSASVPPELTTAERSAAATLLQLARNGDASAMGALLEGNRERLRRIVRVRLGSRLRWFLETSDVVQETHRAAVDALRRLEFADERNLLAWMARVATNRIRDEHERYVAERRHADREVRLGTVEGGAHEIHGDPSPSQAAAREELRELLDRCLSELPEDYREVIVLRDYCGASWEHVTVELGGRSLHAVQQLHQRAWIKLRRRVVPLLDP